MGMSGSTHAQVNTNLNNFFLNGTQPQDNNPNFQGFLSSQDCMGCHIDTSTGNFEVPIFNRWEGSMKANAVRDPLWKASLAIANQDAPMSGDLCIRCHSPTGWIEGRSIPTDGTALGGQFGELRADLEGVTCTVCHRMVDPIAKPENPAEDDPIRNALINAGMLPTSWGNGSYVVDTLDVRRGPYPHNPSGPNPFPNVRTNMHGVPIIHSPFHQKSEMCGTCHDVSNPVLVRQQDGSYVPNPEGIAHPTQDKYEMFPLERTFSEWSNSQYASIGVQAGGVFGGNHPTGIMHSCQDCHMPDKNTYGCYFEPAAWLRPDVPSHDFSGGNAWVQDILANTEEYISDTYVGNLMASKNRSIYMLQNAATLEVTDEGCEIRVRIINETGHKLPTGYPEGRRMWIQVDFHDESLEPITTRGYYHSFSADLNHWDTKVYEAVLGLDGLMASISGVAEGPSFHFVLNNKIYKDNRIPPRGFNNAAFASVQAAPVGYVYQDGQYWDDTLFRVPPEASGATVSLYYQTASKEYIEFLRDENYTNDAGDQLYAQWLLTGMSPPVRMRERAVSNLSPGFPADADCSGTVTVADVIGIENCLTGPYDSLLLGCEVFDMDLDGDVDLVDIKSLQSAFTP